VQERRCRKVTRGLRKSWRAVEQRVHACRQSMGLESDVKSSLCEQSMKAFYRAAPNYGFGE